MPDATGTTPDEWSAWRAFLAANAQLSVEIDRRLRTQHGISQGEYGTLAAIRDARGRHLRVGELAVLLGWERSRVSHLVMRMEQRGLVARDDRSADGRATDIVLTRLGVKTLLGAVRDHAADLHDLFFTQMTPAEREVVQTVMDNILKNLAGSTRPEKPPRPAGSG